MERKDHLPLHRAGGRSGYSCSAIVVTVCVGRHYYTASDYLSFVESVFQNRNQYRVEEINSFFLAYSNGRSAVAFPDVEKLIQSVKKIQKVVDLDEKKQYSLRINITNVRQEKRTVKTNLRKK